MRKYIYIYIYIYIHTHIDRKQKTSKLVLYNLEVCSEVPGIALFKKEFSSLGSVNYHDII